MSDFQRTVGRIMTPEEAQQKCIEMGLHEAYPRAMEHVVGVFAHFQDYAEDERVVRDDGRLGLGQQWEVHKEELARALGLGTGQAHNAVYEEPYPLVETVWQAFFQE